MSNNKNRKVYNAWVSMRQRCCNPEATNYGDYGGRGIKVCERWQEFENFYEDMGEPPSSDHSLDRIDNDGDYCPVNCRWATRHEQHRNKRNNRRLTLEGTTLTVAEWAGRLNVPAITLYSRLRQGWTDKDILTEPVQRRLITFQGKTQSISAWSKELGVNRRTLGMRLDAYGWTIEEALTVRPE